jgi:hypothetical protein
VTVLVERLPLRGLQTEHWLMSCADCTYLLLSCGAQDSGTDGAGYETAIKGGALAAAGKPKSRPASKPGTKKVSRSTGMQ